MSLTTKQIPTASPHALTITLGCVCYSLVMRWLPLLTITGLTLVAVGCAQPRDVAVSPPSQPVAAASARLTITKQGQPIAFQPTGVYCKGKPGELRHLIAKTNNQIPLVEVTPGQAAMVKLEQRGAPEKTTSMAGITVGRESITFSATTFGQVTLNGTLTCTKFEG